MSAGMGDKVIISNYGNSRCGFTGTQCMFCHAKVPCLKEGYAVRHVGGIIVYVCKQKEEKRGVPLFLLILK